MAGNPETTIHVGYKRTFQVKPYETQVIEISVSGTSVENVLKECSPENLRKLARSYQDLEKTGDDLITESLEKIHNAPEPDASKFSPQPAAPRRK